MYLYFSLNVADMNTSHQLAPSIKTSHVLYPSPSSGGSDEAIIPYWLGDKGFDYLYGTKNTSFIGRYLLKNKTY